MTIQAITFDFWATLYRPKTVDYNRRLLRLKDAVEQGCGAAFELEQFQAAVDTARTTWSRIWLEEQRTLTARHWLDIILKTLTVSLSETSFQGIQTTLENSVLENRPQMAPEAQTVLDNLSKNYKQAIISDTGLTPGRILRKILEQDNLLHYFTHLTFSDEVGRSKPHPTAFFTPYSHGL